MNRRTFVAATAGAAAAAVAFNPVTAAAQPRTQDDFADADRGFIAALVPGVVKDAAGKVVWDNDAYAAAALGPYRAHRGERKVTGLIYTHPHVDHFGGSRGVLPEGAVGGVPVLAPGGIHGARRLGERVRGYGDDASRRVHVRGASAEVTRGADQLWARSERVAGDGRAGAADGCGW